MKIRIIGCSGSGKTFLAKRLSKKYDITRGENSGKRENTTGRNAGVSGQTFTSADSRLEKKISSLDGRKNYRGIGSTLKNILIKQGAIEVISAFDSYGDFRKKIMGSITIFNFIYLHQRKSDGIFRPIFYFPKPLK